MPSTTPGTPLAWVTVFIAMVAYLVFFGWQSLNEYWAYEMHALDLGNMGQAAWNTVHGHPFRFTNMRLPYAIEAWGTTTRLSFHVEALFPVMSLVYLIYPHPESLLVLQTLALASGAIPVFLLARDVLRHSILSIAFVLAYLLFPTLEGMNLYEFHPVSLATPLLLFAFWFAWGRAWIACVLCCLAAMGTKEEIGLVVAMFGLYIALVLRERRVGIGLALVGVGWSLFAVLVVEHHYRSPGSQSYLHTRYHYLGHGVSGALHTVLHDPGVFLRVLLTWPKAGYLLRLFAPVGFTCLAAPELLFLGLPTFALNLLSTDFHMFTGVGDNSAELIAVVMISGIMGTGRLMTWVRPYFLPGVPARVLSALVAGVAIMTQVANGYTPVGAFYHQPIVTARDRLADRFVAMVPAGAPVSTQDQLDPHLSSRRYLYLFQDTGRQPPLVPANYVLLDVAAPTYPLPSFELHDYAAGMLSRGWGVAAADDGLILIEKGLTSRIIPTGFYRYALANGHRPPHALSGTVYGLNLSGYDLARTDLANHRIPNLALTLYLSPARSHLGDIQPVLFELMNRTMIGCSNEPLGLAWYPTSRWSPRHSYVIRMTPLETQWLTPGTAQLFLGFMPVPAGSHPDCAHDWARHGKLFALGNLDLRF